LKVEQAAVFMQWFQDLFEVTVTLKKEGETAGEE
jgi:hypothetical protein